ncbi:hypothetical protein ABPG72_009840 [Tetrahymena utriculariae]
MQQQNTNKSSSKNIISQKRLRPNISQTEFVKISGLQQWKNCQNFIGKIVSLHITNKSLSPQEDGTQTSVVFLSGTVGDETGVIDFDFQEQRNTPHFKVDNLNLNNNLSHLKLTNCPNINQRYIRGEFLGVKNEEKDGNTIYIYTVKNAQGEVQSLATRRYITKFNVGEICTISRERRRQNNILNQQKTNLSRDHHARQSQKCHNGDIKNNQNKRNLIDERNQRQKLPIVNVKKNNEIRQTDIKSLILGKRGQVVYGQVTEVDVLSKQIGETTLHFVKGRIVDSKANIKFHIKKPCHFDLMVGKVQVSKILTIRLMKMVSTLLI